MSVIGIARQRTRLWHPCLEVSEGDKCRLFPARAIRGKCSWPFAGHSLLFAMRRYQGLLHVKDHLMATVNSDAPHHIQIILGTVP